MRRILLLLAPLLLLPVGVGHEEDGFGHLSVDVADLAPGETKVYHLAPSTGGEAITLSQGWVFGVYGGVQGNGSDVVQVFLYHDGIATANWTWTSGYHRNTTRLHFTGDYEIRTHNPGDAKVRYAFYYDQSCNCKGKAIPLPGGWNLFNYDLPAGREVRFGLPLARTYEVRGTLATLSSSSDAQWPRDFRILDEAQGQGPQWLNFTFVPDKSQRYYVYVEAVKGAQLGTPMELTPLLEVEPKESPAPMPLLGLGLAFLATLALRGGRA